MQHPGWLLVLIGVVIAVMGLIWLVSAQIPGLGRLPGDISFQGKNVRFYFPIATCVLVSVVLSLVMWILSRLR